MANKVYLHAETAIRFKSSGGDAAFTPTSVADGAGRISARHDLGSGARARRYEWRAKTKLANAADVGRAVEVYLCTSDGTIADGNQSTSNAAFAAADKRRNLKLLGMIEVDKNDASEPFHASGIVEIDGRYVSVVWWNDTGKALSGTAGDHEFILTPVPDEVQ